jgi:thioredoxin 1
MIELTSQEDFESLLKNEKRPIILDFYASWCGPCKKIAPYFEDLSQMYKNVCFVKVNCDVADDVSENFHVENLPTFVLLKNGVEFTRFCGGRKENLEEMVHKAM